MTVSREQVDAVLNLLDLYDAIYPTNYEEEKQRFFDALDAGEQYNPQYTYTTPDMETVEDRLIALENTAASRLDKQLVAGMRGTQQLIAAIGSPAITDVSKDVYGTPDDDMVQAAENMHQEPVDRSDEPAIPAETIQAVFEQLFDTLGMTYECRLIPEETNRNDPLQQQILIGEDITFRPLRAQRMLIHESTHAVRTYNGMQTGEPALMYGTDGYEIAEEGLPTFNEHAVDVFRDTAPKITSRVIAVAAADRSFHDLYQLMRDYRLGRRLAFIRTFRIKRGLTDTARPGGFLKDHIYFAGYSTLREHPDLADDLYIGKISFQDIDEVEHEYRPNVTRDEHINAYNSVSEMLTSPRE